MSPLSTSTHRRSSVGSFAVAVATAFAWLAATPAAPAQWSQQFGSSLAEQINSVATDASGNVYAGGTVNGPVLGQPAQGLEDNILVKYDSAGNQQWVRQFGTSANDEVNSVVRVGANIAVGGITLGKMGAASFGNVDSFVQLYNSAGTVLWTTQFGTSTVDRVHALAADGLGHLYVGGYTSGSIGGTNAGFRDAYVTQLNAATGAINWSKQFGTASDDYGDAVAVDNQGSVFLSGRAGGALFGPYGGGSDGFVVKLDVTGTTLWSRQLGTSGTDNLWSLQVDGAGNLIASGSSSGALGGAAIGGLDGIVLKLSGTDGQTIWGKQFGTTGTDEVLGSAIGPDGQILLGGYTTGTLPGQTTSGARDAFIRILNPDGTLVDHQQFGSAGNDTVNAVTLDDAGHLVAGGYTDGSLPGATNAGGNDGFTTVLPGTIPEPASASLLALSGLALLARRRSGGTAW